MPARIALMLLGSCSMTAMSKRYADVDVLRKRATEHDSSVGHANLDMATQRKDSGDDDDADRTACVCFLEKLEIDRWGPDEKYKFADLDEAGDFGNRDDCAAQCPAACHSKFKFKFDPKEAAYLGEDSVKVATIAAKCDDDGECDCLDATQSVEQVREYNQRHHGENIDITHVKGEYSNPQECLQECECKDKESDGWFTDKEWDYEGLCVDEWHWPQVLKYNSGECNPPWDPVGLVTCDYWQQFKLKEKSEGDKHEYKVELDELEDGEGNEVAKDIDLKIIKMGEAEGLWSTSDYKVGPKSIRKSFQVHKSGLVQRRWSWRLVDSDGNILYTINKQKWEILMGNVWKVYKGHKEDGHLLYYARGESDSYSSTEDFEFKFYRSKEMEEVVGTLEHKKRDEEDNEDKYKVKVKPGEDGGLIVLTSILIDKAFDMKREQQEE